MGLESKGKQEIREQVWSQLGCSRVSRFPGARGRIPNFVGAERAAQILGFLPIWKRARVVKADLDAPSFQCCEVLPAEPIEAIPVLAALHHSTSPERRGSRGRLA